MRGNGQVFVIVVASLVVLCTQCLQPCGSKLVGSSLSNTTGLRSSTTLTHRLTTLKAQGYGALRQLLTQTKEASKSQKTQKPNGWLLKHHRNLMNPNGTTSPQFSLRLHSTARPFGQGKGRARGKGKLQLPLTKHNLNFLLRRAMLRRLRGKSLPLTSGKSMVNGGRLPIRAGRPPLHPGSGITKLSSNSKPRPFPLKPDKGGIILPFNMKVIRRNRNWCKMVSFRQKIHHKNCQPVFVDNNVCYGQCMSYYVPHLFQSCAACMATSEITIEVKLKCSGQTPDKVTKKVKIVDSCRCRATSCSL